ncbi:hypothetical protein IH779_00210 [Patescibacteria group bacterium]|nr:hypothetical protein [Patescibacteria group bacterium]
MSQKFVNQGIGQEEVFKKRAGIFVKILFPLLLLGLPIVILSYSDFIGRIIMPYLSEEVVQKVPLLVQDIEFQTRLILIFTLILGLFLGILISRHFSKLLNRISNGLKRILAGDLEFRIKIESYDEIGEIAYFLNRVVDELKRSRMKLKEREGDLQEKSQELIEKIRILELSGQEAEETRLATLNILEDIGDTSEALEVEKKRIENIILFLADGLLVLQDSEILLSNPSAKTIFGIKANDIIKKSTDSLQKYQNLKILFEFLKESKKRPILRREIVFQNPERTFQITVISIGAGQDLIILHDITREKLIEQMKTEFVSLAAHQLRTPLSAIKWTLKMILDEDLGKITKDQRNFLQKTYLSNERMISLINDLLNVARIEEGRYLYKLSLYRLEDIVQSVVNSYIDMAKRKKITFTFKKPKRKSPKLKIDIEKMNSAIQNIIDNAIRYTHKGGKVTVSLKSGRKEIELRIQDSGIGVPKNQQERVFSKFFRGVNVMRMETEGSGLGLFITKNIIEAHGGKIWFESEENKGTTIYLTLPIKQT